MHSQPGDRNCGTKAIGGVHHGPVLIYMAKVDDATTATTGSFFKVAEDGYQGSTPTWGTEILNANCGKRAFQVPSNIAPGDYLVRAEVIALHVGRYSPQPFVSCFQVRVTGGGNAYPAGVNFPGAYSLKCVKVLNILTTAVLTYAVIHSFPSPSTSLISSMSAPDRLCTLVRSMF